MPTKKRFPNDERCIKCDQLLRYDTGQKKVIASEIEANLFSVELDKKVDVGNILCGKCRRSTRPVGAVPDLSTLSHDDHVTPPPDADAEMLMAVDPNPPSTSHDHHEIPPLEGRLEDPNIPSTSHGHHETLPQDGDRVERQLSQLSNLSTQTTTSESLLSQSFGDPSFGVRVRDPTHRETIEMPFKRVVATHKYCCVCLVPAKNYIVVPFKARLQVFISSRIFIPTGNRCCPEHVINDRFYVDEITKLNIVSSTCTIDSDELALFLNTLSKNCNNSILDRVDDNNLSDERIKSLTGFTVAQINILKNLLVSMRNSGNRSVNQALFVFLFKLRTGNSNSITASIFDIKYEQNVSDYCESVLNAFQKDVLPLRLGAQACSREDLIANHTSPYVKKLHGFEDRLIMIADGSYLRHQKSSNNCYQKKSYSGQKKCPLCKPFTVCTTDGYVIDVYGPYEGTLNDAAIMKKVLEDPNGLRSILKKGDVFILDRGFRDVKDWLESEGFVVLMPALKGKRKQLPTIEANESRFVTKLRWVVEAVHGIIGTKFKLLHNQFNNNMLTSAMLYCKVANFLVNEFGKRLNYDTDLQDEIAEQMLLKKDVDNSLAKVVEEEYWNRKKKIFKPLTSDDVSDFPEMTEKELKILFTGSYQLSLTVSYLAEIYTEDGLLNMKFLLENNSILRCEVKSRHINRKVYKCYVHYTPNTIGLGGIKEYVCDCANGLRTVGCCAHVATIIYFLCHARYLSKIIRPAQILTNLFHVERVEPVINEDSDED